MFIAEGATQGNATGVLISDPCFFQRTKLLHAPGVIGSTRTFRGRDLWRSLGRRWCARWREETRLGFLDEQWNEST